MIKTIMNDDSRKKKLLFIVSVVIEAVFIIAGAAGIAGSQRYHCDYQPENMITEAEVEDEDGPAGTDFCETQELTLPRKGIYKVTIALTPGNEGVTSAVRVNDAPRTDRLDTEITDIGYMESLCSYNIYAHEGELPVTVRVEHQTAEGDAGNGLDVRFICVDYMKWNTLTWYALTWLFIFAIADVILWILCFKRDSFVAFLHTERGTATVFLAIAVAVTSTPLMLEHIPAGDDLSFHLMRIQGIADGLAGGYFPVKIHPGWFNGFGYAVGVYYGQILLYPSAVLRFLGFPLGTTYKLYVVLVNILTALVAYISGKKLFRDNFISCAFAIFYTLSLYRLIDLHKRSAAGEAAAMIFLPLVAAGLAMIYGYAEDERKRGWCWLAAGVTGMIGTHVLTIFMAVIMGVLFVLMHLKETFRKDTLSQYLKAICAVIILNLYFIVPMLDYALNLSIKMKEQKKDMIAKAAYLPQVFSQVYDVNGTNGSHTPIGDMPLSIGVSALLVLAALIFAICRSSLGKRRRIVMSVALILAVSVWMSTDVFPYKFLEHRLNGVYSFLQHLQYPWRFLAIASLAIAILFGLVLLLIKDSYDSRICILSAIVIIAVTLIQSSGMEDSIIHEKQGKAFFNPSYDYYYSDEYMPRNTDMDELYDTDVITSSADVAVTGYDRKGINYTVSVENKSADIGYVQLPLVCYPHYDARSENGDSLDVIAGDYYKLCFAVPSGYNGKVYIRFREPFYWRMAEIISLFMLILGVIAGFSTFPARRSI